MRLFSLELSTTAYRADFVVYGLAAAGLALYVGGAMVLGLAAPHGPTQLLFGLVLAGLALWSAIEYAMHRFVFHGLPPFRAMHALHHQRPTALICSPTLVTAGLFAVLVFLPALAGLPTLAAGPGLAACALTLGVLGGYLGYSITHHAVHHWHGNSAWLRQRKRWHARHHGTQDARICFGVSTGLWDHLCATTPRRRPVGAS